MNAIQKMTTGSLASILVSFLSILILLFGCTGLSSEKRAQVREFRKTCLDKYPEEDYVPSAVNNSAHSRYIPSKFNKDSQSRSQWYEMVRTYSIYRDYWDSIARKTYMYSELRCISDVLREYDVIIARDKERALEQYLVEKEKMEKISEQRKRATELAMERYERLLRERERKAKEQEEELRRFFQQSMINSPNSRNNDQTTISQPPFPEKCTDGHILKREFINRSSRVTPPDRKAARKDICVFEVQIQNNRAQISYRNCWSNGACDWIDDTIERLKERSTHGEFHTSCGYGAYFGTMKNDERLYICWYRE